MVIEAIIIMCGTPICLYAYLFHVSLLWKNIQAFRMMQEMPPLGTPPKEIKEIIEKALSKAKEKEEEDGVMFQ